jgi:hypothetical protein
MDFTRNRSKTHHSPSQGSAGAGGVAGKSAQPNLALVILDYYSSRVQLLELAAISP